MKKLFAVVLLLALALCGCKNIPENEGLGDVSKYNTKLFENISFDQHNHQEIYHSFFPFL